MNVNLGKGCNWDKELEYAYTSRYEVTPQFIREKDCVVNKKDEKTSTALKI